MSIPLKSINPFLKFNPKKIVLNSEIWDINCVLFTRPQVHFCPLLQAFVVPSLGVFCVILESVCRRQSPQLASVKASPGPKRGVQLDCTRGRGWKKRSFNRQKLGEKKGLKDLPSPRSIPSIPLGFGGQGVAGGCWWSDDGKNLRFRKFCKRFSVTWHSRKLSRLT